MFGPTNIFGLSLFTLCKSRVICVCVSLKVIEGQSSVSISHPLFYWKHEGVVKLTKLFFFFFSPQYPHVHVILLSSTKVLLTKSNICDLSLFVCCFFSCEIISYFNVIMFNMYYTQLLKKKLY